MVSRSTGRRRAVTQERDRLAALLEQRLADVDTAVEAQRDLAAARGQVADLCREVDRLRSELADARRERQRLKRLLQRTQMVARNYAEYLDAAERRRRDGGWWPRLTAMLAGRRGPTEATHESPPGATA